ncbi:cullin-2 [Octopus bimaculoides]|uniref:Cullin-2 n=1 Tax=Octopus bimaculoides TaxID=37653 RepID=A0A0L8FHD7_OCTBM|nr:cullin-2 [Octopus bimaculoides]XP_052826532.1 cullin-2 [Octopus bimaculoides]XP_052826533.1 cullin-2 [Octopus bimaculoides]XP_052826534.1 cullin-2 [Octopus bimaculoides]|eukprot:XP_014789803.1 PREDICTED: cullin-2-like [Octopus bimaculoides]
MSLKPRKVDFNATWQILLETVRGVITCGQVARSIWNDRFSDVYALCVAVPESYSDRLYEEIKNFAENHVECLYKTVRNDSNILSAYHKHWQEYSQGSIYLNQLFGYLNTTYIKKQKLSDADLAYGSFNYEASDQKLEIGELCLDIWKRHMIEPLKLQLILLILQEIQKDRNGGYVNQAVLHGVINSFVNVEEYKKKEQVQFYRKLFETRFLQETGEYYKQEAAKLKVEFNCSEYMEKVIQKLGQENLRSRKFLHPSSYEKVTHETQERMVADHIYFLHAACEDMVQSERRKDLSNMYVLLKPIHNGLNYLIDQVESYIRETGLNAVQDLKGDNVPCMFVESMLEVHKKYTELIQSVFNNDQKFIQALDKACAAAINNKFKGECKSPELLAKYNDNLLKKSSKGISESELDEKLDNCITVFKYLEDKDIYQRFYSRMLAKRLIYNASTSMDAEESMINKLKQACGYEFTNKLHQMFTDMTISKDLDKKFEDYYKNKDIDIGIGFSILVLQAGAWPIRQSGFPTFAIPQELEKSVRMFEMFYNKNFSGRKLTWMHYSCLADVRFNYLKKTYTVTMGTYHMAILLLFNNAESLTFRELMDSSQLPEKELSKQLQVLVESKIILTENEINENSTLHLNKNYSNKRLRFRISMMQKLTPQEVAHTHTSVDNDRKMYLQAAIVRIMKARKVSRHNLLIDEVIKQSKSRFTPSVSLIKKCVETLIDRQYLERSPNQADEYVYVA